MEQPEQYGLIGYPLEHSFSPRYFAEKFKRENINARYEAFPLANIEELKGLFTLHKNLKGLNVTIPYKAEVMQQLDEINADAQLVGAVNCIDLTNGKKTGYNTDIIGFTKSLVPLLKKQHTDALVLGSGGSSKAIVFVLNKLGINHKIGSRQNADGAIAYEDITEDIIAAHKLIINTTPLGMYPMVEECADISYSAISDEHLLYDLIYNPEQTMFLQKGALQGAQIKNGLEMLELQAEASWDIWNHTLPTV